MKDAQSQAENPLSALMVTEPQIVTQQARLKIDFSAQNLEEGGEGNSKALSYQQP